MSEDRSLRNVIIGFIIGVGSVLPGVSGGILASVSGYTRLVTAVIARGSNDFWFLLTIGGVWPSARYHRAGLTTPAITL